MWTSTSPSAFCSNICSCSIQCSKRARQKKKKSLVEKIFLTHVWNGQILTGGIWVHVSGYEVLPPVTHAICPARSYRVAHLSFLMFHSYLNSSGSVQLSPWQIQKAEQQGQVQSSCTKEPSKECGDLILWMKKHFPTALFNSLKQSQNLPWSSMCIIVPNNFQDDCQKNLIAINFLCCKPWNFC